MISQRSLWAGLAVSAAFLSIFAYLFLPFDEIGEVVRNANFLYVGPALVVYFIAVYFRTLRWRYLLGPLIGRPQRALFPVVVVGYMANNILPVRLGEVVRSYYVGLREEVSPASALGTVMVERVFDVATLFFFIAVVWLLPVGDMLGRLADDLPGGTPLLLGLSVLPFLVVMVIVGVITAVPTGTLLRLLERLLVLAPGGLRRRLLGLAEKLIVGLTVVRSPRGLATMLLLSAPVWVAETVMLGIIALGFDVRSAFANDFEMIAAMMLFASIANLALVVPAAAGGIGPFNFFGAATLVALGVADAEAGAFVLTAHIALLLPVTVLGFTFLLTDRVSLRGLLARATAGEAGGDAPTGARAREAPR